MGKARRKKQPVPHHLPGHTAMSAALIDLVAPLYDEDMPLKAYQSIIGLGALAWNIAQFPKPQRKEQLQAFLKAGDFQLTFDEIVAAGSDGEVMEEPRPGMDIITLIKALIHRKDRLFPDDQRLVVNWEVYWKGDELHVSAASSVPKPSAAAG